METRKEYLNRKAKEWYREHKNPNPKEYKHKTEEQKKEYRRQAQKEHYKKYADKVKKKRMNRYYDTEFIKKIKNNQKEIINGEICYHITQKTANKLLKSDMPLSIIGYNKKLYVSFNERR